MARAVQAMLAAQRPEGSWEGDPVYQGFNTPFRATQFAVMSLSTLYPGPTKAKNWDAAYPPPPAKLATHNLPLLLAQLDQFWDLAPEATLRQIREVLVKSDQPLAREAAARALGHMADPGSLPALIQALGDPSKMVQTSAAYALRMVLSRRQDAAPAGRKLLIAALEVARCAHPLGRHPRLQSTFQGAHRRPGFARGPGKRFERFRPVCSFSSGFRLVALVLLASGPATGAAEHAGSLGHAPEHREQSDGAPRPRGEHLRFARREYRLPGSVGARQLPRMRTRTALRTGTKRSCATRPRCLPRCCARALRWGAKAS